MAHHSPYRINRGPRQVCLELGDLRDVVPGVEIDVAEFHPPRQDYVAVQRGIDKHQPLDWHLFGHLKGYRATVAVAHQNVLWLDVGQEYPYDRRIDPARLQGRYPAVIGVFMRPRQVGDQRRDSRIAGRSVNPVQEDDHGSFGIPGSAGSFGIGNGSQFNLTTAGIP